MAFDLLAPATRDRNASPGNDHYPALGDVCLELLDKGFLIQSKTPRGCGAMLDRIGMPEKQNEETTY
jgi:hypothetical protein